MKKEDLLNKLSELWEKELLPILRQKEADRLKARKIYLFWKFIAFVSPLILLINWFALTKNIFIGDVGFITFMIIMFGSCFAMAIAIKMMFDISKKFDSYVKKDIITKLFNVISTVPEFKIEMKNNNRLDINTINQSNIFAEANVIDYNDTFEGTAFKIPITIKELGLFYSDSKYDKSRDNSFSVFNGCLISIDMNKKFKGHTIIKSKQFFPKLPDLSTASIVLKLYYFFEIINKAKNLKNYTKVITEYSYFNNRYDTLSTDQIEARYLLTTAFIERFCNLKTAFHTKKINCSLKDNKILFAFSLKEDLFKIGYLNEPLTNKKHFNMVIEQVLSLMDFVEYFKLNLNIGL